jgi:hypothetical protein
MRVDFYGLAFETPCVTFSLWDPWRATALEHRLFKAVQGLAGTEVTHEPDQEAVHVTNPKTCRQALQGLARVLKGWQEEADPGGERRTWRWLVEGDTDADGYDHNGDEASLWAFVRVSVDRGGPGEEPKGEDVDLEGFTFRIWSNPDR